MIHQVIFNTSKIFSQKGIKHVVLSPGSRNAPLTISFARNPDIEIHSIVDERSAGFIALGMAQRLKEPVVLCCTSGTSLLNYAPAVAEAYYQQIPLIVVSADRPPEWQGQRDGQTIQQPRALAEFVKKEFELPAQPDHQDEVWEYSRKLNEAVNLASLTPYGPVHINIPFREPFYPDEGDQLEFSKELPIVHPVISHKTVDFSQLLQRWNTFNKRLIICGQHSADHGLNQLLKKVQNQAVVVSEVISNTGTEGIRHHDLFLGSKNPTLLESLQPEILITIGKSLISKNLKLFLREYSPVEHWHFDEGMIHADPLKSMTRLIEAEPHGFLEAIAHSEPESDEFNVQLQENYLQNWSVENKKANRLLHKTLKASEFSEFKAFRQVIEALPGKIDLHLGNSTPVRYANFIQGFSPKTEVFCNRGTSGIDGTNGTAVGNALVSRQPTVLLTGDLSFFYDRNAFLHSHDLSKLKIIVFNNKGGGIFRLIGGPSKLPELEKYFETRHNHSAKFTALEYGFDYFKATNSTTLNKALEATFDDDKTPKLIEIFTDPEINQKVFFSVLKAIRE